MFRLQVRTVNKDEDNNNLSGWKAFLTFKKLCAKYNINLDTSFLFDIVSFKVSITTLLSLYYDIL